MNTPTLGDRVRVVDPRSCFNGECGTVVRNDVPMLLGARIAYGVELDMDNYRFNMDYELHQLTGVED